MSESFASLARIFMQIYHEGKGKNIFIEIGLNSQRVGGRAVSRSFDARERGIIYYLGLTSLTNFNRLNFTNVSLFYSYVGTKVGL